LCAPYMYKNYYKTQKSQTRPDSNIVALPPF